MRESEEKLVQKAKNGDAESFGALYDLYMPRIYRFVFLRTRGREDAEDLTHQVFMNAWQNLHRYETRGFPFGSWLYRIASNAVIDYYRTAKAHAPLEAVPEEVFAEPNTMGDVVDTAINLDRIRITLASLEPDQQNVLLMKFVDDMTNKEIADALGKTEGAVRVIQHRAIKKLRSLHPQEIGE
ncbi:MAG: sigma-70 family RNA polymerase sigma factor [Candidatus Brennerbacteria bacterium]|nr:sigma-70 family RNA polymerase sigma factor [Candidatus Brennerbacteria bacterium]